MNKIMLALLTLMCVPIIAEAAPTLDLTQTQNPSAIWRLFPTKNLFTFIELNTETGAMFRLQWGMSDAQRFQVPLCGGCNQSKEAPQAQPGRFTLYPTENIFQFILLDQVTGSAWQVQWANKGMVTPIYVIPYSALSPSPSMK